METIKCLLGCNHNIKTTKSTCYGGVQKYVITCRKHRKYRTFEVCWNDKYDIPCMIDKLEAK